MELSYRVSGESTVIPFHGFMFILSLILLYIAFWRIRLELFGTIIVLFLGSNPFQIFEVYRRDNVFGWPITTAILILALHVPILKKQKPEPSVIFWATPVITGSFLAFMGQVRNESVAIIISAALCYFFISKISLLKRFSLLCLLLFSFFIGNYSWESYFSYKTKQAETIVATSGGTPYQVKVLILICYGIQFLPDLATLIKNMVMGGMTGLQRCTQNRF